MNRTKTSGTVADNSGLENQLGATFSFQSGACSQVALTVNVTVAIRLGQHEDPGNVAMVFRAIMMSAPKFIHNVFHLSTPFHSDYNKGSRRGCPPRTCR